MSNSMIEFSILKTFSMKGHRGKAPIIKEITWYPPLCGWIKCNTNGASRGYLGLFATGGIFRDNSAAILGCFAQFIGISNSITVEFMAAIFAIETAFKKGWKNLWLECDSLIVVQAFSSNYKVPWKIQNQWLNCLVLCKQMNFGVFHIYREGNNCVDKLAIYAISNRDNFLCSTPRIFYAILYSSLFFNKLLVCCR